MLFLDIKLIDIYEKKKDPEDGFLYITYTDLEVFGFMSKWNDINVYIFHNQNHHKVINDALIAVDYDT